MKSKIIAAALAIVMVLGLSACSLEVENTAGTNATPAYNGSNGELVVHFIDVGQGDSEFIEFPNGKTMLIDAGETDRGDDVVSYLSSFGVKAIDYLVATHPHSDHIGGLPEVFDAFDIDTVYLPNGTSSSYSFEKLLDKIDAEGCTVIEAKAGVSVISESELTAEFLAPISDEYEDKNNYSAVLMVKYVDNSFLFMGDAETLVEKQIKQNVSADVIKVGHHGSVTSSGMEFIKRVNPTYAVFEVGAGNSYGHPHREIIERYNQIGATLLRTDELGTIVISSDGSEINVKDNAGNPAAVTDITDKAETDAAYSTSAVSYVLNTKSKKIHMPDCASSSSIAEENRELTDKSISELEALGYTCCKSCNPK